jgi:hypothetical protein
MGYPDPLFGGCKLTARKPSMTPITCAQVFRNGYPEDTNEQSLGHVMYREEFGLSTITCEFSNASPSRGVQLGGRTRREAMMVSLYSLVEKHLRERYYIVSRGTFE